MTLSNIELEILSMATEDLNGLWEVLWYLCTLFPNKDKHELRMTAESIVKKLLTLGLIYLCRYSSAKDEEVLLQSDEVSAVLSNQENWEPPSTITSTHIRFSSTDKGEHLYYSKDDDDLIT